MALIKQKETKMKKSLKLLSVLAMLGLTQILSACAKNISQGIPCEALSLIYYEDIQPLSAEIEVLRNNAVIEEVCK